MCCLKRRAEGRQKSKKSQCKSVFLCSHKSAGHKVRSSRPSASRQVRTHSMMYKKRGHLCELPHVIVHVIVWEINRLQHHKAPRTDSNANSFSKQTICQTVVGDSTCKISNSVVLLFVKSANFHYWSKVKFSKYGFLIVRQKCNFSESWWKKTRQEKRVPWTTYTKKSGTRTPKNNSAPISCCWKLKREGEGVLGKCRVASRASSRVRSEFFFDFCDGPPFAERPVQGAVMLKLAIGKAEQCQQDSVQELEDRVVAELAERGIPIKRGSEDRGEVLIDYPYLELLLKAAQDPEIRKRLQKAANRSSNVQQHAAPCTFRAPRQNRRMTRRQHRIVIYQWVLLQLNQFGVICHDGSGMAAGVNHPGEHSRYMACSSQCQQRQCTRCLEGSRARSQLGGSSRRVGGGTEEVSES